jgi:hypothetical protein
MLQSCSVATHLLLKGGGRIFFVCLIFLQQMYATHISIKQLRLMVQQEATDKLAYLFIICSFNSWSPLHPSLHAVRCCCCCLVMLLWLDAMAVVHLSRLAAIKQYRHVK